MSPGNGALHGMFTKSKTPNSKVFKKGWASKASKFRYWRYWGHFKKRKFAHAKRYCKKVSPLLLLSQHLYATRRNLSASSAPKSLRKRWFEQYPQSANTRRPAPRRVGHLCDCSTPIPAGSATRATGLAVVGRRCLERQLRFALPPFDHGPSKNLG